VPAALWDPLPALIRGRAQLAGGDLIAATASLQKASATARSVGAAGTRALASAMLDQARLLVGRTSRHAEPAADTAEVVAILAENDGIAAWRTGDGETALSALDRAVDSWAAMGATAWLARVHRMRAEVLRATGDRARGAAADARADAVIAAVAMPARERATIARPIGELR
jgi:hypothetical protein